MTMQEFIDDNRTWISDAIWAICPNIPLDDDELELWINNDESLYFMAKDAGVNLDE